ncbi:putative DNA polymerase zeta catalytic subunit [Cucumis melo var. makuwa]|nr:putative DNA polymerase zeta catalytic subunit [Cucumis melo var. makuwa]
MEQTDVTLKLLIDKKTERVLYGEADKKFIDFLVNVLSLPLGGVIMLLKKNGMVGCLGNLYESVETLNKSYLQPNQSRDTVLKPKILFNSFTKLLPNVHVPAAATPPAIFYCNGSTYSSCRAYVSYSSSAVCPKCDKKLSQSCTYVTPPKAENQPASGGGSVKDLATYIVMDDLTVKHISDFSITTLLKKFNIKDVDSLEEKVITLDVDEGVELLEASLQSKTVLTNAFLKRRRPHIDSDVKLSESLNPSV